MDYQALERLDRIELVETFKNLNHLDLISAKNASVILKIKLDDAESQLYRFYCERDFQHSVPYGLDSKSYYAGLLKNSSWFYYSHDLKTYIFASTIHGSKAIKNFLKNKLRRERLSIADLNAQLLFSKEVLLVKGHQYIDMLPEDMHTEALMNYFRDDMESYENSVRQYYLHFNEAMTKIEIIPYNRSQELEPTAVITME